MREADMILPNMRGASVQVGSRVHALFLPSPTRPRTPSMADGERHGDVRTAFAARATAAGTRSEA